MNDDFDPSDALIHATSDIVVSYVRNNALRLEDLSAFIIGVHDSLRTLSNAADEVQPETGQAPAVAVKKSVTPDHIICLECGAKFKAIKRHLFTSHQMTPDQYRAKWALPGDYPIVTSSYSSARSAMAKAAGLGRKAAPQAEAGVLRKPTRARKAATN